MVNISIPSGVFNIYYDAVNWMIDSDYIGRQCQVVYPEERSACSNCVSNSLPGSPSTNVYRNGGPMPFSFGNCPMCGGQGYKSSTTTDNVRLRIYHQHKDWMKVGNYAQMALRAGVVQVIGYLADLIKIRKADYTILVSEQQQYQTYKYNLSGEPFFHGFGKDKYFVAYMERMN